MILTLSNTLINNLKALYSDTTMDIEKFLTMQESDFQEIKGLGKTKIQELMNFQRKLREFNDISDCDLLLLLNTSNFIRQLLVKLNISPHQFLYTSFKDIEEFVKITPKRKREILSFKKEIVKAKYNNTSEIDVPQEELVNNIVQYIMSKLLILDYSIDEEKVRDYVSSFNLNNVDLDKHLAELIPMLNLEEGIPLPDLSRSYLLELLRNSKKPLTTFRLREQILELVYIKRDDFTQLTQILIEEGFLEFTSMGIRATQPHVKNFIYKHIHKFWVVNKRFEGLTLREIGEIKGVSRERIRQLEQKEIKLLPHQEMYEWRFKNFYENYDLTNEEFCQVFNITEYELNFLEFFCEKDTKLKSKEQLLKEESLFIRDTERLINLIEKDYYTIEGRKIKKDRQSVSSYFVERFAVDNIHFSDFYERVTQAINEYSIEIDTGSMRSYEATIERLDNVISKSGRTIRYYPFDQFDMDYFFSSIDFSLFMNTEISTLKILETYQQLCEQYDIRDEYELHNIIKRHPEKTPSYVTLKRTPMITIGNATRFDQLLELITEYSPIHQDELALKYHEIYRVKMETIKANFLKEASLHLNGDVFRVETSEVELEILEVLKSDLTEDFYFKEDIYEMYQQKFPQKTINFSLYFNELGYRNFSQFILKDKYSRADLFFKEKYFSSDIFKITDKRFYSLGSYLNTLETLRANLDIFEFQKEHYISFSKIHENIGVTKSDIKELIEEILDFVKYDYFTIFSIEHIIDKSVFAEFGFDDIFYESLLKRDPRLRFQYMGGRVVLKQIKEKFFTYHLIEDLVIKFKRIDIYDLMTYLNEQLGIDLPKEKITDVTNHTEIYYHPIMEMLYQDEDEFYEMLEED